MFYFICATIAAAAVSAATDSAAAIRFALFFRNDSHFKKSSIEAKKKCSANCNNNNELNPNSIERAKK